MTEFHTRTFTLSDGSVVRTILRNSDADLTDEQVRERYGPLAEHVFRPEREETS
jgi:hypothetical protein